jgi:predicted HTH transcriptional regulator
LYKIYYSRLTKSWLEYFVEGVNISIEAVKERIVKLSSQRLRKAKERQIVLTERQIKIIEFINQNGKITNRGAREMFKLSDEGDLKEIKKLVNLEIIKSEGKGRALQYIPK